MKKISVLPSLLTLGNAFCGFLAILKAADAATAHALGLQALFVAKLEMAVLLIFLAMLFDALDGKVARLTNQATDFGAQLDSLSDAVTFGVAPALVAKLLLETEGVKVMPFLVRHPRAIFLAATVFALFAVMRLARFNVETAGHEENDHSRFKGLPTPAAAGFVASAALFWLHRDDPILRELPDGFFRSLLIGLPWALVVAGLMMVSTIPFPHILDVLFRGRRTFPFLAGLVMALGLATLSYEAALLAVTAGYIVSGPVVLLLDLLPWRKRRRLAAPVYRGPRSAVG